MVDTTVEGAIHELCDAVDQLRRKPEDRELQEAVCLGTRYALSTFETAWILSDREYDAVSIQRLQHAIDSALAILPQATGYWKSVSERGQALADVLAGRQKV
jgi:hypothetical protein